MTRRSASIRDPPCSFGERSRGSRTGHAIVQCLAGHAVAMMPANGGGIAMRLVSLLLASLIAAASLSTAGRAADGTPTHIRGTVQSLDGQALVVASRDGPVVTVVLAKDVKVSTLTKVDLAAIKAGDFIGT